MLVFLVSLILLGLLVFTIVYLLQRANGNQLATCESLEIAERAGSYSKCAYSGIYTGDVQWLASDGLTELVLSRFPTKISRACYSADDTETSLCRDMISPDNCGSLAKPYTVSDGKIYYIRRIGRCTTV